MAKIIGIHGIGQRDCEPAGLEESWWRAIRTTTDAKPKITNLPRHEFKLVYYADLYDSHGTRGLAREYDANDLDTDWEQEFVISLGEAAEALLEVNADPTRLVKVPGDLQRALNLVMRVPGLGSITEYHQAAQRGSSLYE
jgi:hypothetical protein